MPLSRYEKIVADWDAIKTDLAFIPNFDSYQPDEQDDWQKLELKDFPWTKVVSYPLMNVGNNERDVISYINEHREARGLATFSTDTCRIQELSAWANSGDVFKNLWVWFSLFEFCQRANYDYTVIKTDQDVPKLSLTSKTLFCKLTWHKFEEGDPEIVEYVRKDNAWAGMLNCFGTKDVVQVGVKRCRRCGFRQCVERRGIWPLGKLHAWTDISDKRYKEVVAMPRFTGS